MADEIICALAEALRDRIGEEYEVYTEGVFMNAVKPCAFVECEKAEKLPLLGKRYILRIHALITIEDERDEKMYEGDKMTRAIFDAMAWIKGPSGLFRGRGVNARRENGRLLLRGAYDAFLSEENKASGTEEDIGMMETLERK